jgi:hypothetical protein
MNLQIVVDSLRWVFFALLVLFGGWVILANWTTPFRRKGGSMVPVVGGMLVAIGFAISPVDDLHWLWWAPLVVDLGSVPLFLFMAVFFLWQAISRKRS